MQAEYLSIVRQGYLIAAGINALLAKRIAGGGGAVAELDFVVPPEGGDDGSATRGIQIANKASAFAAQMKSLIDKPLAACVE